MKEFLVNVREVRTREYRIKAESGRQAEQKYNDGDHGEPETDEIEEAVVGDVKEVET